MKVTLVMVSTINGKITLGDDSHISNWTSEEDKKHFFSMITNSRLMVMGSSTYIAAKNVIELDKNILRIVMTRYPEKYKDDVVPGQLEFSDESALDLIKRMETLGYTDMLLAGGGEINATFFESNLVTDISLTIEPKLFGKGKPLVGEGDFFLSMRLKSIKQLNEKGTLLLHYCVQ